LEDDSATFANEFEIVAGGEHFQERFMFGSCHVRNSKGRPTRKYSLQSTCHKGV
jgi:hypothetical protein